MARELSGRDRGRGARPHARPPHAGARRRRLRLSLRLACLGTGTIVPHPRRGASGYALIRDDGAVLLVECGPGSTRRWPALGLAPEAVRGVLVTHHHVDHCGDLDAILFERALAERAGAFAVAGPEGHRRFVDGLAETYGEGVREAAARAAVSELGEGGTLEHEGFRIEARHVVHVPGALGVRVQAGGRTFAFSGDSGPCDALVALCRGADLALLECSYPADRESRKHLNARTAAEVAREAGVRRLVLTHFYPQCDSVDLAGQVRDAGFDGELYLAADGDAFDV